jgi:FMN-dependent NADH-azoreductase
MKAILYLSCSPGGAGAVSRIMADEVVTHLRRLHPAATVAERDLAANPPALVDAGFRAAILAPPDFSHPALAASEALIAELEACDALVIATPMHNYCVPAVLKAWIDQIVRIHRTFASTPAGKRGVMADRPVYVVVASGGWFSGPSPTGVPPQPDFLTPYLRAVFATIGLRDVRFLTLEGVTRGPEMRDAAFAAARAKLAEWLPA